MHHNNHLTDEDKPDNHHNKSDNEKNEIIGILANAGMLPIHQIEISDEAERVGPTQDELAALHGNVGTLGIGGWLCRRACDVLEAGAVSACALLSNPIAVAACIALAHKGGNECRKRC